MKLTSQFVLAGFLALALHAQTVATTTVQGGIYQADGTPVSGTLQLSWPAFTTAAGQAVAAGRLSVPIAPDGTFSVSLAPNIGATPAGLFYTAVYHLNTGTTSTEYWIVPATSPATLAQVRAQVMPAVQAVQAVSKTYVDQSIQQLSQSLLSPAGGTLTGPLTAPKLGGIFQADQSPGADFGARLQACINGLDKTYGGTCDARNFSGSLAMANDLTIATPNVTVQLPCATISTSKQIVIPAGVRNTRLEGCSYQGGSAANGTAGGTVWIYTGSGPAIQVGDPTYARDTKGFHLADINLNTATASSQATALAFYRTQEIDLRSLYLVGNNSSGQTGLLLDGTGNYTGGTFDSNTISGFSTALYLTGHLSGSALGDYANAGTFTRLHIDCPTVNGSPLAGTYGVNIVAGDGNTFTGGDVEGCATMFHLGPNAVNNTIVGLRNENSSIQYQADSGSSFNAVFTGGTFFTGQLIDNGSRNSFWDAFHRTANGIKGDWYASQQDATIINHLRLGIGAGTVRGLQWESQVDQGTSNTVYNWLWGLTDGAGGQSNWLFQDLINNTIRLQLQQNNTAGGNNQTALNAAGSGNVCFNCSANSGTGGAAFSSGGASPSTVATIDASGNATLYGYHRFYANGAEQWRFNCASNTYCNFDDMNSGAAVHRIRIYTGSGMDLDAEGSSAVTVNNSSNSGTGGFSVYAGGSNANHAIFRAAPNGSSSVVQAPDLAANAGRNCLQVDTSGYITNTGSPCNSGAINSGSAGQLAYYASNGAALSPLTTVPISAGGTGAATASAALSALGAASVSSSSAQSFAGPLAAPSLNASVNKTILVTAPPYNALCDATIAPWNAAPISVSPSGTTSGYTFAAADVGKTINFGYFLNSRIYSFSTTIQSVNAGNATLAAAPATAFTTTTWTYGHLDTAAIQSAFNDAQSKNQPVQFPPGSCLFATIVYKGQTFFGAGENLTTLIGLPGQDLFQGPDSAISYPQQALIHDLTFAIDSSLNAAATAGGGNNTFPNRITGTLGGTTPIAPALNVGPVTWTAGAACGAAISAGSTTATVPCGYFNTAPLPTIVGQPITLNGAGPNGANLSTSIAAYLSATQVTLNAAASTTVSSAAGQWGPSLNPPWYIGNCGLAIPHSDWNVTINNNIGWTFKNLLFQAINNPQIRASSTCGLFFQNAPYEHHFEKIDFNYLYAGYVEALPAQNFTANQSYWTPDTTSYKDINSRQTFLPMLWYNGTHRVLDGLSIYGSVTAYGLGLLQFATAGGYPNATLLHYYHECGVNNTGEVFRSTGSNNVFLSGAFTQCQGQQYVNWLGSNGTADGAMLALQVAGHDNVFRHTGLTAASLTDTGVDNEIETGYGSDAWNFVKRRSYLNRTRQPLNRLDPGFLWTGNSTTPYTSGADLLITCAEFNFAFQNGTSNANGCSSDPTGTEITQSYFHADSVNYATGWSFASLAPPAVGPQGLGPYGKLLIVGDRLPQTTTNLLIQARCSAACTHSYTVKDITSSTTLATATVSFGTSWTTQSIPVNLSTVPIGDILSIATTGTLWAGYTSEDIAYFAFAPLNNDAVNAATTAATSAASNAAKAQATATVVSGVGVFPTITAANWIWGGVPGSADPTSPTGYSTNVPNFTALQSVNGSTNLAGGALFPALYGQVGVTTRAPSVWTDTLSTAQTSSQTTLAIATPTTSIWESGGCLMVDQEIECWSGALTLGATSFTVSRGQYGTTARAHASGATYSLIGIASFYLQCPSGTNQAAPLLVFTNNWTTTYGAFNGQNCSGQQANFAISFETGPVGMQFLVTSININPFAGIAQAPAANYAMVSALGNGSIPNWTSSKALAGSGAGIVTGPTSTTAGHLLTYTGTAGQTQDSGVALTSIQPLSATTGSLGGTALNPGCTNQATITVTGASTSMACIMSGAGGTQPANILPRCFVSAANTVTPQLCTAVATTPAAQTYNIRLIP